MMINSTRLKHGLIMTSTVLHKVIDEISMENDPVGMPSSFEADSETNTALPNDIIESQEEAKTDENNQNIQSVTEGEESQNNYENESLSTDNPSQNSLDVLSKACDNMSDGVIEPEPNTNKDTSFTEEREYTLTNQDHNSTIQEAHYAIEEGTTCNEIDSQLFVEYTCEENNTHPSDTNTHDENLTNDQALRKSGRKRKPRPPSPDIGQKTLTSKKPRSPMNTKINRTKKVMGEPFKCDLCGSPNVTDPTRRGNRAKVSTCAASPRHKKDPETGKILTLCNACGLSFNRPKKSRQKVVIDPEAKKAYLDEARQFASSLADGLEEQDALRLYCPRFKTFACGCLQKYILADGDMDESRERAQQLLNLLKQAKLLSKQKCYNAEETLENPLERKGKKGKNIGLGNGQRKSKEFEEFVLTQRKYLREELKLCEQGTQRVLNYSNNFLHKKLKTDPTKPLRVERQKGQAVLGKLKPIEELPSEACCVDKCVAMAVTHSKLLQQWRDRSVSGQAEARRVLAEMLTPSGGARSNCYKFISWVTGCSHSTIGRVNEQMKKTGGDREPPAHGLINWWKENPKPKKVKIKAVPHSTGNPSHTVQIQHLTGAQLHSLPQVGILQAAANSAGISTAILPSSQLQGNPQVIAINPAHLTQLNVSNLSLPASQAGTPRQIILTPTQHTQIQLQQLQQQQHQLQIQTIQLQQQLQQQLHQEQQAQIQPQTAVPQPNQNEAQSIQIQIPSQVISTTDGTCLTLASSHEFPTVPFTTTLQPVSQGQTVVPTNCVSSNLNSTTQVPQGTSLNSDTFLTSETLHIINSGQTVQAPHVVTLQCSNETTPTQAVPVSLIQTPVSLTL